MLVAAVATVLVGVFLFVSSGRTRGSKEQALGPPNRPAPIVILAFDELPVASLMNERGDIDGRLYPNFARLRHDSIWFRNATTVATSTRKAIPALLTGTHPGHDELATRESHNLFTLLGSSYRVRTPHAVPGVCGPPVCGAGQQSGDAVALPKELRVFGPGPRGRDLTKFLGFLGDDDQPEIYFLHLVMPHSPWRYLPSGQRYAGTEPTPGETEVVGFGKAWRRDAWLVVQAYQRHLLQVGFSDVVLGALLRRLEATDVYDEALVVVTADHGIGLRPGLPKRLVRKETAGEIAAVPLFLKLPFQERGRVSDLPVQLIDVVPTIADVVNIPDLWRDIDGSSALNHSIDPSRMRRIEGVELDPRGIEKYQMVKRKYETFGRYEGSIDLFELGPGSSERLLGRRPTELQVVAGGVVTVHVANRQIYENATRDDAFFPGLLEGTLHGTDAKTRPVVAVAVNGRIAAVTRSSSDRGVVRFYCVLPPESFTGPPNDLEIFLVEDPEAGRLTRLKDSNTAFSQAGGQHDRP